MRFKNYGRGVRRVPGQMNNWERQYADQLHKLQLAGEVQAYWFDAVKLRLADNTFYTPDFLVLMADGLIEVHEVKGHWEDDARVKIKVAADKFPFRFKAITKAKGQWEVEEI
jgi:hypothetical protein